MITKNKSTIIRRLSSLSMLLVLLTHNVITSDTFSGEVFYIFIFRTFTRIAVPVFFIISSYLLFNNYSLDKIAKRTKTILVPFILWSLISYAIFAILPIIPGVKNYFNSAADFSIESLIQSTIIAPKNGSLWFLRDLFILIILSPLINWLTKHKITLFIIPILFIVWLFDWHYTFMLESTLFFLIGSELSTPMVNTISIPKYKNANITTLLIPLAISLLFAYIAAKYLVNPMIFTKLTILISILWIIYFRDVFLQDGFFTKTLDKFKEYSFFMFVTNSIILSFLKKPIPPLHNTLISIVLYTISFALLLCICIITQNLLKKYFPKTFNILTGNR